MIKEKLLKYLTAFSVFLTVLQAKAANAQISYMGPPGPWPKPTTGSTPTPTPSSDIVTIVAGSALLVFALIGIAVVIKWVVVLIIKLIKGGK